MNPKQKKAPTIFENFAMTSYDLTLINQASIHYAKNIETLLLSLMLVSNMGKFFSATMIVAAPKNKH